MLRNKKRKKQISVMRKWKFENNKKKNKEHKQ